MNVPMWKLDKHLEDPFNIWISHWDLRMADYKSLFSEIQLKMDLALAKEQDPATEL